MFIYKFHFTSNIKEKENGKASDEALKLIVKISEGSVRDALSLLDTALLTLDKDKELDLAAAQKIFGYFDKSQLINLFIEKDIEEYGLLGGAIVLFLYMFFLYRIILLVKNSPRAFGALVAFGIRNVADLDAGLREVHRVLKPGARFVILEFSTPPLAIVRTFYHLYFHHVLP